MQQIVIIGGGTAGWMAAIALSSRFPKTTIVVIDPSKITPIGVGESVTGVVQQFVGDPLHNLSMPEFFQRTNATLKLGVQYVDWQGKGTQYLAPIDTPPHYFKRSHPLVTEEFYAMAAADKQKLGDVLLYSQLMKANRTDYFFKPDGSVDSSLAHASCQFDAPKFAAWLKELAPQRPNIRHIDAIMSAFEQNAESGFVESVTLDNGQIVTGDFFIDCSGFRRQLFQKAFTPKWIDYSQYIKVDSAIPVSVEYKADEEIPVFTQSTALPNGWAWRVPTQGRFGKGYLFSSKYVDDEQAIREFHGSGIDPDSPPQIIRFQPGKLESQWEKNVCCIGLAGGFIEALESTTIHTTYNQLMLLADLLLPNYNRNSALGLSRQYNELISAAFDDYVDFINFHYAAGRDDTEFWRDYQKDESLTERNRWRREKWKYSFPTREDFAPQRTLRVGLTVGLVVWAPMLCAFGMLSQENAQRLLSGSKALSITHENVQQYIQIRQLITANALTHEQTLRYLKGMN